MTNKELKQQAREQLKGYRGKFALLIFITYLITGLLYFGIYKADLPVRPYTFIVGTYVQIFLLSFFLLFKRKNEMCIVEALKNWKAYLKYILVNLIYGIIIFGIVLVVLFITSFANIYIFMSVSASHEFTVSLVVLILTVLLVAVLIIIGMFIIYVVYFATPFLLIDGLSVGESLSHSSRMMKGYKWELIKLMLSFIGWYLLSVLTAGILFLWVIPYYKLTVVNFYTNLQSK